MRNTQKIKLVIASVIGALFLAAAVVPAGSSEGKVTWRGNGWNGETCDSFESGNPLTPGSNERVWHFVLTSPVDPGDLFFGGSPPGVAPQPRNGNGAAHWYVVTSIDADPSGTYVEATSGKVLTISHCEDGPTVPTTTTTTTEPPTTEPPAVLIPPSMIVVEAPPADPAVVTPTYTG